MTDTITRLNAALESRYTIQRELGEGEMATVYLAGVEPVAARPDRGLILGWKTCRSLASLADRARDGAGPGSSSFRTGR